MPHLTKLLQELREGLEGVSPGPWSDGNEAINARLSNQDRPWNSTVFSGGEVLLALTFASTSDQCVAIAKHIARCSPDNIRALLAALDEARKVVERPLIYEVDGESGEIHLTINRVKIGTFPAHSQEAIALLKLEAECRAFLSRFDPPP